MGEVLKELKKENINCNIHFAATSSEEVGIRGKDINTINKSRYSICNRCSMC